MGLSAPRCADRGARGGRGGGRGTTCPSGACWRRWPARSSPATSSAAPGCAALPPERPWPPSCKVLLHTCPWIELQRCAYILYVLVTVWQASIYHRCGVCIPQASAPPPCPAATHAVSVIRGRVSSSEPPRGSIITPRHTRGPAPSGGRGRQVRIRVISIFRRVTQQVRKLSSMGAAPIADDDPERGCEGAGAPPALKPSQKSRAPGFDGFAGGAAATGRASVSPSPPPAPPGGQLRDVRVPLMRLHAGRAACFIGPWACECSS